MNASGQRKNKREINGENWMEKETFEGDAKASKGLNKEQHRGTEMIQQ